ncbi:phage baseplate protein [Serratia inhibens]|uniref:phage baseplate protein n=1 Tax=Serratia inhibens TaxID=2338073 RepID=UPI003217834D
MAKNDFKPFAIGEFSNVLSQEEYEALPAVGAGFNTGTARSEQLNKVWRQSSVMAAVLGKFISDNSGDDVLDDGNINKILLSLSKALSKPIVDVSHPVGIVSWFAQNKNPNELFPGTSWSYIGENKTIRLAKSDGTDVLSEGGDDNVTLSVNNIPSHNHEFSANTSDFDYGTKNTSSNGEHSHNVGLDFGDKSAGGSGPLSVQTAVKYTSQDGEHSHSVDIGSHSHTVSGSTGNSGGGDSFSVVNAYVKLMGWYRTA